MHVLPGATSAPLEYSSRVRFEIQNKKKYIIIRNNAHALTRASARTHSLVYAFTHTYTYTYTHTQTHVLLYVIFFKSGLRPAGPPPPRQSFAYTPPIHVFYGLLWREKKKRNNNKYSKAHTIRFNTLYYCMYIIICVMSSLLLVV